MDGQQIATQAVSAEVGTALTSARRLEAISSPEFCDLALPGILPLGDDSVNGQRCSAESAMNRCAKLLSCVALICLSGCTLPDLLFGMFGKGYSGGGTLPSEKRTHYDQIVDESQRFGSFRSKDHQTGSPWDATQRR